LCESIECVVDLPDLAQCELVPLPFDGSEISICERIPIDSSVEKTGFIEDEHIVVHDSAIGDFLDQQQLIVWKSSPHVNFAQESFSIDWWYSFLVNRPQRAIIKGRDRCWLIDKTQHTIPIIVRLLKWESRSLYRKLNILLATTVAIPNTFTS
jgi:hypothetical protein